MSFTDMKCLCERMRSLGCRQVISMENFRSPNFELVAELLYWLLRRYDPDTAIVDDIDTPQERVRFLQDVAQTFLIKGSVKLNIKRLYAADSKAIREILKVANLLYKASLQTKVDAGELVRQTDAAMMDLGTLDMDVKHARQLIADIKRSGTNIYDGLAKEQTLKEARQLAVAKQTDKADVGHAIQEAIDQLVQGHDSLQNSLEDLENQKRDAADKLRRKKAELERMEQRLMQLKNVRAPYQDELDALELELSGLYGVYMTKFRSLEYLEFQLSKIRRSEEERMKAEEAKLERLRRKLAVRELQIVRGQVSINERDLNEHFNSGGSEDSEESLTITCEPEGAPMITVERPSAPANGQRIHGSLMAGGDQKYDNSDEDASEQDDAVEFERFDASGTNVIQISREPAVGRLAEPDSLGGERFGSGDEVFIADDDF